MGLWPRWGLALRLWLLRHVGRRAEYLRGREHLHGGHHDFGRRRYAHEKARLPRYRDGGRRRARKQREQDPRGGEEDGRRPSQITHRYTRKTNFDSPELKNKTPKTNHTEIQ